jgi:hypothetical protein
MRQWCALPDVSRVAALYHHRQSGEYRVLYLKHPDGPVYYVLTVGSSSLEGQRCIEPPLPSPSAKNFFIHTRLHYKYHPVLLNDCLHWYSTWYDCSSKDNESMVVVFDTVGESFRFMPSPVAGHVAHLHQVDGTLKIHQLDRGTMTVHVWALQDYEMEVWSLKHRIQLPVVEMKKFVSEAILFLVAVCGNGDMLLSSRYPLLFHCDSKGKLVDKFKEDLVDPKVLQLSLKESLVRHAFFERKNRKRVKPQSFFRRL